MTDKEILLDALEQEKNIAVNMMYALNEASHEKLYKDLFSMTKKISENTKSIFDLAYSLNYYELVAEDKDKISQKVNKLNTELIKFYEDLQKDKEN